MKRTEQLDQRVKQLDGLPLPVPARVHRRAVRALRDNESSLREMAEQIQQSPTLALAILRQANARVSHADAIALSLEVAISRLGVQRTASLVEELPALEETQMPLALRQLLLISQHASTQASGFFAARLARLWQEIHWGSLLFMSPYWALLYAYPELFEDWARRTQSGTFPEEGNEHELFNLPLVRLGLELAERWKLPEWIVRGYRLLLEDRRQLVQALHIARGHAHPLEQRQRLDAQPELSRWLTQPANTVLLANGLALSAHDGWGTHHHLRWQQLCGLYLEQPLDELHQAVHQHAASSARLHHQPGLWHPAEALLWPWVSDGRHAPVERNNAPPSSDPSLEWRQRCTQLLRDPSPFASLTELSECAARALHSSGLNQVLLFDASTQPPALLHAAGWNGQARIASSLSTTPLLSRILQTRGRLSIDHVNAGRFKALLPASLRQLFDGDLLIAGLGTSGASELLVCVARDGEPFDPALQRVVDKTLQCVERALQQRSAT